MGNISSSPAAAAPLLQSAADATNRRQAAAAAATAAAGTQAEPVGAVNSSAAPGAAASSTGQNASIAGIGLSPAAAALASLAAADGAPAAAASSADVSKGSGRQQKRMLQLEAKLQVYMDSEDRRVKELTEGILYELLPAALNVMLPTCEDPLKELDPERCRAVAGAALAASALMNAPPGFLEFLLCIPWRRLPQLYPSAIKAGAAAAAADSHSAEQQQEQQHTQPSQDDLLAESAADEAERQLLVNLPLHPQLVQPVLLFMYKPQHADSVPPVLRPDKKRQRQHADQQSSQPGQQHVQGVHKADCTADENLLAVAEALLDGATPLHCAALRGNPAQVDHLLYCGADPARRTAAGDSPLQLVPKCGGYNKVTRTRVCSCLGPAEQEVWECRSRIARTLIASKCLTAFHVGLLHYLSLLVLCLMAFLGVNWGQRAALHRLLAHMQRREEQQQQEARERTCAALEAMRQEASLGQAHLTLAKQQIGGRHLAQQHSSRNGLSSRDRDGSVWQGAGRWADAGSPAAAVGGLRSGAAPFERSAGNMGALGHDMPQQSALQEDAEASASALPRPVSTGTPAGGGVAGLAGSDASAAAGSSQEPVAPGTPSASEEAAATYATAGKARRSASGGLCWSPLVGSTQPSLLGEQQSDGSSRSGYSIPHNIDSEPINSTNGSGSTLPSGPQTVQQPDPVSEQTHRQHLLHELFSAANTTAADASPTVAAAAALAVDAEHTWSDLCGCLPMTAQAQNGFSEVAFKCFVRAVHTLQRLNLQDNCTPLAVCQADTGDAATASAAGTAAAASNSDAAASGAAAAMPVTMNAAGASAATSARLQAAASAAGVIGPLPNGLAAAMSLDALGSSPRGSSSGAGPADGVDTSASPTATHLQQPGQQQLRVLEDEQATLYCCWSESVLLKHTACACAGCTALAVHAIRMAHIAVVRLFNRVHKERLQVPLRWRAVGQALSRIVYVHIALLCRTDATASPSKASVWRAQQCLREWDKLLAAGLAGGADQQEAAAALTAGRTVEDVVDTLRMWTKTADSDLIIAEALLGSSLPNLTTLDDALAAAFVPPLPPMYSSGSSNAPGGSHPWSAAATGGSSTSCPPVLVRPVSAALLNQLQTARGLALCPSPAVKQLAAQVAEATAAELSAGARLKELLAGRTPPSTQEGVAALAAAIAAAESFSSLAQDVDAARALHQQSCARAEVAAQLQAVVDKVHGLTSRVALLPSSGTSSSGGAASVGGGVSSGGGSAASRSSGGGSSSTGSCGGHEGGGALGLPLQGFDVADWQQYVAMLEAAVEPAKDANLSVTKARKLIKELQAQVAAAEAAAALDAVMSKRPCGSNALKTAISKAEAASSAVSSTTSTSIGGSFAGSGASAAASAPGVASAAAAGSSSCVLSELLVVRLQAAKKRLEVEKAAEALHKASMTYKNVADLPKLETAVLNARKVGAEELAPDEYKAASELRARLTGALRVRQQLETALKGLATTSLGTGPRGRQLEQLAEPVEAAIKEAAKWDDLLPGEAARATELLEVWRTSSACEAKLSRALRDGCSAAALSRIIADAAAAGVKVTSARRVLKLQQVLEAAVAAASESAASAAVGSGHGQLVAKLEAAEAGGVAPSVLQPARQLLRRLLAVDARKALEAALKPHSDWSANTRIATLRAALDKAEEAMGCSVQDLEEQHQQQDQEPGADVPQQQDQQHRPSSQTEAAAAATAAVEGTDQAKQQQPQPRRHAASTTCSISTAASTCSKGVQQQLVRSDSVASSSACSEASSLAPSSTAGGASSTAGDVHSSSKASASGVDAEVLSVLQELSLHAWQVLQQDQQQLEERERERLEHERARRERERNERQRAETERAERGKAEREKAAQERKAARAKAAAERAKAFTVVFGTSAGGSAFGSSLARSSSKREPTKPSTDSTPAGALSDSDRPAAAAGDAGAAGIGSPKLPPSATGSTSQHSGARQAQEPPSQPVRAKRWGPSRQQSQEQDAAQLAEGNVQVAADAAETAGSGATPSAALDGQAASDIAAVAVAHARCDSYDILGDEHSKLGQDMLALLDLPEDGQPASTPPAGQQAQHLQQPAALQVQQQQQQVQPHASLRCTMSADAVALCAAEADSSQQQGGSHPATPKFNLVDLGGAAWGLDSADTRAGLGQQVRPTSAGSCMMSLSPAAATGALATAAMDVARQSLDLPSGPATSSQANIWRSPLGLGIEGPSGLPPVAPRGQQLPLRHAVAHNNRSLTDDGTGSTVLDSLRQRQQLQQQHLVQGATSFDPVSSPAGRISPVGTAVTTLAAGQLPEPAFSYTHSSGFAAGTSMCMSSPRSYPQLQQAHPSLLQNQLASHSRSTGGGALLSLYDDGTSRTAAAINSMEGGAQAWAMQQQAQQRPSVAVSAGPVGAAAHMQDSSCFSNRPQQCPALSVAEALHFEQQLQLQQQQQVRLHHMQQQQAQAAVHAGFASSNLSATATSLTAAALLSPAMSSALAAPTSCVMTSQSPSPLVAQAGGVGALSSSFAFGAPYSSSFSPAPLRVSALGGASAAVESLVARGTTSGMHLHDSSTLRPSATAGPGAGAGADVCNEASGGGGGHSSRNLRPELLLPDDLNFSPPSSGPAGRLQD